MLKRFTKKAKNVVNMDIKNGLKFFLLARFNRDFALHMSAVNRLL